MPDDVVRLTQDWEVGGHFMSTSWWALCNLPRPFDPLALENLLSEYTLFALPSLLDMLSSSMSPTTCRLAAGGLTVQQKNPPAHGAWDGLEACNVASGLIWRTADRGRRSWAITYMPGTPSQFVELGWQLSATGWGNILDSATNFWHNMQTLPSYPELTLVLGTLHRQRHGVPLGASEFSIYIDVAPAPKVVTIRRRIPNRRVVLPF